MPEHEPLHTPAPVQVRTYKPSDRDVVQRLFKEGLLAGQIQKDDTGSDIDHIEHAYFQDERNHLWVADLDGQVLGMIGVLQGKGHTGEIRRLRVQKDHQGNGIASRLVEVAVEHCQHHGYLKVVFDTRFEPQCDPGLLVGMFERVGFQHTRTKNMGSKDLHEFYLDLYRQPEPQPNHTLPK